MATYIKTLLEYSTGDTIYPKTKSDAVYRTDNVTVAETTLAAADTHIANTNNPHNVTATQLNVYTKTEIDNAGYLTSIPQASSSVLGGIKIGSGLTISSGGVVSVTGGGVADSVAWGHITGTLADQTDLNNILGTIPTNVSDLPNDAGYITGITSSDVTNALGYTPYSSANPNGYTSNTGTITGISINSTSIATSGVANITSIPLSIISGASDLKAIEAISSNSGLLKKTAANTWSLDTSSYITVNDVPKEVIVVNCQYDLYTEKFVIDSDYNTILSAYNDNQLIHFTIQGVGETLDVHPYSSTEIIAVIENSGYRYTYTIDSNNNITQSIFHLPVSFFDNDAGYITSYTETDPIFSASAAAGITSSDITNWNSKTSNTGTVTKVTAGTGLKIGTASSGGDITTSGTINHINSVTAQTTQAVYPIKIDAQGHISAYGTAVTIVNTRGTATSGGTTLSVVNTGDMYTWNNKQNKATTLAGYGITDAKISNGTITLGSNTITPLTSETYTGTVTSVRVQATSPVQSSTSTAQSTSLNTTISLANAYGDTKNPYGTKTANYVLAGPTSGSASAPSFRALVAGDIPDLSSTYATKSTTLSGYGITDAKISNGTITLGSNTITPLTSFTEADPIFSASAAAGITSTDITNWNNKVSDDKTWNSVSLTKTSSSTAAAGYVPYVSSTSATSANYYPVAQAGSTDANAIPKYSSAGYLFAYTPSSDDNSTKVATTAFVATALSGKVSSSTTAKIFVQSSTPTGMSAGDIWIDTTGL